MTNSVNTLTKDAQQNAPFISANGYPDVFTPALLRGELAPQDRDVLEQQSAISADAIEARGYFTTRDTATLERLGFKPRQCLTPALVIPLHNWCGEVVGHQIRPHIPRNDERGKPRKYELPAKSANVLDFSPLMRNKVADLLTPLVIVEGIKKGDSGATHGLLTLSLIGVDNWRGKNETGATVPLPDWEYIPVKDRVVAIAYDSDARTNPNVERARERLANFLLARGAVVKIVDFASGPNGEKIGLDDFFARGGTVAELFALARDLEPVEARRSRQIAATTNLPDTNAATFPELPAEKIPAPKLTNEHGGREYDARQIVELLRPKWEVAALTTHAAHAARIGTHMADDVVFCPSLGWLFWNRRHWEQDDRSNTATAARVASLSRVVRAEAAALYRNAATLAAANRTGDASALSTSAGELLKHAKQVEGMNFIDGALHLAAGTMRCAVSAFDQKPWRIGFANGTWDAGQWREHRREDFALHLSPVAVDLTGDRSEWLAVLERITGGDADYQRTLQDVAGYALSGASHLRLLPWLYGPAGTGKSTFAELLQTVLADMAANLDPKKLGDDTARERLGADLWNKRVAVCSEAGSQRLEAELLKTLSGSDSLTVRFLYREQFKAPPCHLLMMVANDPPKVDAYDAALKDRVMALPFTHPLSSPQPLQLTGGARIEAVRRDPRSPLVRGFAAWAVDGLARLYRSQTIHRAECVEKATRRFWLDADPLTPFWDELKDEVLAAGIAKTELRRKYEDWCNKEGARPVSAQRFNKACDSHGLIEERPGGVRSWFLAKPTGKTGK